MKFKNIFFSVIACLGIVLSFVTFTLDNTISDLSLISAMADSNGHYEAPESITFIETLGLLYLSSGLSYPFNATEKTVEMGFQTILSTDIRELLTTNKNNSLLDYDKVIGADIDTSGETEGIQDLNKNFNWEEMYTKNISLTKDSKGQTISQEDVIVSFTTPIGVDIHNIDTVSNLWNLNYRFYKEGLIGVEPSYWGSYLFAEEEMFDRAYTSLKWLCQDYLNCAIVNDGVEVFEAIIATNDSKYYWYLYLDKLYNYDALNLGKKGNFIAMTVEPISMEDAFDILNTLGKTETFE